MASDTRLLPERYASPRLIGRGGMGEIYVADDTVLGRKVAVKLLDERFARDGQVRRRFTREALTAAKLSGHPNIVTIFDVGECDGRPFIVMEYLGGGTVADAARSGPVASAQTLAWLEEAAAALEEAHAAGIVHRDVKPANLLLDERNRVHVGDYGIARVADESTAGMTAAGTILGTAGYLSPEQARGEPATRASDVYSLAVVAFELLTGGRPFERGSATEEAAAHISDAVPAASSRGVGLPAAVDAVFERALAKDPVDRQPSPGAFVAALRGALAPDAGTTRVLAAPTVPPAAARPEPVAPPRRRSTGSRYGRVLLAALVLAALAAGGVLAAVMGSDGDETASPPNQQVKTVTRTKVTTQQGEATTVFQTTTVPAPETAPSTTDGNQGPGGGGKVSRGEAISLTDQATGLMNSGDYEGALPLALRAYQSLKGTGELYEAYAAYDAGKAYVMLGDCQRGLPLLDASERIQGPRQEIDDARERCA